MIVSRILLIPVIAAVGYEILRSGRATARTRSSRSLLYPGLLVQMITTKQPTDDMIEVAIVSMEQALEADGETVPAGSRVAARARPAADGRRRDRRPTAAPPAADPRRRSDRPAAGS